MEMVHQGVLGISVLPGLPFRIHNSQEDAIAYLFLGQHWAVVDDLRQAAMDVPGVAGEHKDSVPLAKSLIVLEDIASFSLRDDTCAGARPKADIHLVAGDLHELFRRQALREDL